MSARQLVFRPQARTELLAARRWYDRERPGLGEEFAQAASATIEQVATTPDRFPRVAGEIRRALVRRFPYGVFYRLTATETIVLGVVHLHRDPHRWQTRR